MTAPIRPAADHPGLRNMVDDMRLKVGAMGRRSCRHILRRVRQLQPGWSEKEGGTSPTGSPHSAAGSRSGPRPAKAPPSPRLPVTSRAPSWNWLMRQLARGCPVPAVRTFPVWRRSWKCMPA